MQGPSLPQGILLPLSYSLHLELSADMLAAVTTPKDADVLARANVTFAVQQDTGCLWFHAVDLTFHSLYVQLPSSQPQPSCLCDDGGASGCISSDCSQLITATGMLLPVILYAPHSPHLSSLLIDDNQSARQC